MEELAEDDQAVEASVVQGVEDAADHPERRTHTHRRKYPTDARHAPTMKQLRSFGPYAALAL
jgi:hypothetical protein